MKKIIKNALMMLAMVGLVGVASATTKKAATPVFTLTGTVSKVSDGDTFVLVDSAGDSHKIRLYGVDCPEGKQLFGRQATGYVSGLILGKAVVVEVVSGYDRYGRRVGKVYFGEERRFLNAELVRGGYAWWYRQYSKKDTIFGRLETEARAERAGLWSDENPVPPWKFRQKKKAGEE